MRPATLGKPGGSTRRCRRSASPPSRITRVILEDEPLCPRRRASVLAVTGNPSPSVPSNRRIVLYLVLLATLLPEGITGATPPWKWIDPVQLVLVFSLYGPGVLLVRELSVRWRTGWPGIVLLGAAYAIVEEGIAVKTFFHPTLTMLGDLGWYGRWLDVNWVWSVWLSLFHAAFSIAFPIFLVEWRWHHVRGRSLLGIRGTVLVATILAFAAMFDHLFLIPYWPGWPHVLGALIAIAALASASRSLARRVWDRLPAGRAPSRKIYAAAGFLFWGLSILVYAAGPALGGHPAVTFAEGGAMIGSVLLLLRCASGRPEGERYVFAFVAGSVGAFAVWAAFAELAGIRGMSLVGIAFVLLVLRLDRGPRQRPAEAITPSAASREP